jgi:hypothetical protein
VAPADAEASKKPLQAAGLDRLNPLFQDPIRRSLPNSAQHARSPGGTTNGDCRLILIPCSQVGGLTEVERKWLPIPVFEAVDAGLGSGRGGDRTFDAQAVLNARTVTTNSTAPHVTA